MPARRRLARWRTSARRPTAFLRALPDLIIVGAQRCGTSSLYKYLSEHPEVTASTRKETEYFSTRFDAGPDWYRSHFPLRLKGAFSFEATPDYLLHPLAAERAHDLVPKAKVIAMLRDPSSRAFSHYKHNRRLGNEELSFEEALAAEPKRIAGERERLMTDPAYRAVSLRRHGYQERGKYDEQLPAWLGLFGREQVMIVQSEGFFTSPHSAFADVLAFLELAPFEPDEFRNYSTRRQPRAETATESPIDPATHDHLQQVFRPHSLNLTRLLDRELWPSS